MQIFGICLVKDEEDIIKETLTKALTWCDYIFVYDNGSEDKTWEIVIDLSATYKQIVPYKKERRPFRDDLRSHVFNTYKHLSKEGDWWCRLDADEIYIDNPKLFLPKVNKRQHVVFNESYQYYFTDKDFEKWKLDPARYDDCTNYERLLKYYKCNWSEIRFFRYREKMIWGEGSWPTHVGIVSPLRIRLKHLQFRSPKQIEHRLEVRKLAVEEGQISFRSYNSNLNWKEKIVNHNDLSFDDGNSFIKNEQDMPSHMEAIHIRILKYILHGLRIFP